MYLFERFTEEAKRVLTMAQEEAARANHGFVGSQHILLGLLRCEELAAARVFRQLGIEIGPVRATFASITGRHERATAQTPIPTPRVKKVIELAFEEAKRQGDSRVAPEHLLLGLLLEGDGIAARLLADMGATVDGVREVLGLPAAMEAG